MEYYEIIIVDVSSAVNVSNMIHNEIARQMGDVNLMFLAWLMLIIPVMICTSISHATHREPIVIKGEPIEV